MNTNQQNTMVLATVTTVITKVAENHIGKELTMTNDGTLEEIVALEVKAAMDEMK